MNGFSTTTTTTNAEEGNQAAATSSSSSSSSSDEGDKAARKIITETPEAKDDYNLEDASSISQTSEPNKETDQRRRQQYQPRDQRGGDQQRGFRDQRGPGGDREPYRADRQPYRGDREPYRGDRDQNRGDREQQRGGDREPYRGGDREPYRGGDREQYRGGDREQYRDTRPPRYTSGLFKQNAPDESFLQPEVQKTVKFEDYQKTKSYQLQQEIFNLIKNKIGTSDKDKVQHFYTQIRTNLQSILVQDTTVDKIKALILEKKVLDDKELFNARAQQEQIYIGQQVQPSKYEKSGQEFIPEASTDSQKLEPMDPVEYENFVNEQFEELQNEIIINDPSQYELSGGDIYEQIANDGESRYDPSDERESPEDIAEYEEFIRDIKLQHIQQIDGLPKTQFDFDKVSTDLEDFKQRMQVEQESKDQAEGKFYPYFDFEQANDQTIEKTLENQVIDQESINEFEDVWQGLTSDIYGTMRDDLKSQYDQARTLMKLNQSLRQKLLFSVKNARIAINQVVKYKNTFTARLEAQTKEFSNDVIPKKVFNFIKKESNINKQRRDVAKLYQDRQFDTKSRNIDTYNQELAMLLNHYQILSVRKQQEKFLEKIQQIIELIRANQVQPNIITKARMFQFGFISKNNEYANQMLKQMASQDSQYPFSLIDPEVLNQFFSQSLKSDNFSGLGHLIAYVEKYGIDISQWNLANFKSGLDFYFNTEFNLNNVLIFTKYYTYFHDCRLRNQLQTLNKPLAQLSEQEKYTLNSQVFNNQYFVDMRSVFSFLVNKLGSQSALDPISKEDQLWKMIDFFTKSGIQEIAAFGQTNFNSISDKDIAEYFRNHVNDSKTFERTTQVLIRVNDKQSIHNLVIQQLKEYQAQNNALPFSFDTNKVRNAYIRLRSLNDKKHLKLNEKTVEYFLYIFKSLQMWPEIIDLCENFDKFTKNTSSSQGVNEIRNYYLSDTLLQMPSNQHYYELVKAAVFDNEDQKSAGFITAMTKAYFKDGTIEHALKFFENSVQELRDVKQKREDFLVALYESAYGEENAKDVTYEDFKEKYLDMMQISNRCIRESFAIAQLQNVIQGKDYEDIETIFQLYLVQKEELSFLSNLAYPSSQLSTLQSLPLEKMRMNEEQRSELEQLRLRKQALQSKLTYKDLESINQIQQVMKNRKLSIFEGLDEGGADDIKTLFNVMSKEQVEEVLSRGERVKSAIDQLKDEHSQILDDIFQKKEDNIEKALKENMKDMQFPCEWPSKSIDKAIEGTYLKKKINQREVDNFAPEMKMYHDYMLNDDITDEKDPHVIMEEVHDETLIDLKEHLLEAVNARKGKVLQIALGIFNKVQEQAIKTVKFSNLEQIDENKIDPKIINEAIQKFDILYNDPRSPVYSALQTIAQYQGDRNIIQFNQMFKDLEDFMENKIDLNTLQKEQIHLEQLTNEILKSVSVMKNIQKFIIKQQQDLNSEVIEYKSWNQKNDENLATVMEQRIKQLYQEFQSKNEQAKATQEISREDKLDLMRDVLALEYGQQFTSNDQLFPSFYCQDLIVFGLENNLAEAVRLGEKMMSENGYILSREMQMAVKNYLLENTVEYQKAMKRTGPIDNTSLYRSVQKKRGDDSGVTAAIFTLDDPYWRDFLEKNTKRQNQWKIPSHLAWNHKQYGIGGEVMDVKKLIENQKLIRSNFY